MTDRSPTKRALFFYDDYEKDLATEDAEDRQLRMCDSQFFVDPDEVDWRAVHLRQLRDEEWSDRYHANVAAGILEP